MFTESLDSFPEEMRSDFVETEMDGKKGYMHKTDVPLVNSLKNAKQEREEFKRQLDDVNTKLSGFEEAKKTEIEKARNEALETARSKGDVKAIEERYQQQMEDLEKRVREEAYNDAKSEMSKERAAEKADNIADNIGLSLGIDKDDAEAISDLLKAKGRVKVDPETGKEIYYDTKGSALSLDRDGFVSQLKTEAKFKRLIKAELITKGGGNANGNGDGSASTVKTASRSEFNGWSQQQRSAFAKAGGKVIDD